MLNQNSVSLNSQQCRPFLCIFTTFRPGNNKLPVIIFVRVGIVYCIISLPGTVFFRRFIYFFARNLRSPLADLRKTLLRNV